MSPKSSGYSEETGPMIVARRRSRPLPGQTRRPLLSHTCVACEGSWNGRCMNPSARLQTRFSAPDVGSEDIFGQCGAMSPATGVRLLCVNRRRSAPAAGLPARPGTRTRGQGPARRQPGCDIHATPTLVSSGSAGSNAGPASLPRPLSRAGRSSARQHPRQRPTGPLK